MNICGWRVLRFSNKFQQKETWTIEDKILYEICNRVNCSISFRRVQYKTCAHLSQCFPFFPLTREALFLLYPPISYLYWECLIAKVLLPVIFCENGKNRTLILLNLICVLYQVTDCSWNRCLKAVSESHSCPLDKFSEAFRWLTSHVSLVLFYEFCLHEYSSIFWKDFLCVLNYL